jgi:hypothetical protein
MCFESTLILKGVPMKNNMQNNRLTDDKIETAGPVRRRSFLKLLSGSVLGAVGVVAGIERAEANQFGIKRAQKNQFGIKRAKKNQFEPLWKSAQILIGNSPTEQSPSSIIECPLFFENGHFADASHILDLSDLQTTGEVRATLTYHKDTIEPDLSSALATAVTQGSDGVPYLVVAGEGEVTGATGYLKGVTRVIVRCKYKVAEDDANLLLIACINCVAILVRS